MRLRILGLLVAALVVVGCEKQTPASDTPPEPKPAAEESAETPAAEPDPAPAPKAPAVEAPEPEGPVYYVAPNGDAANPGTREAPWDILSALGGKQTVELGATIYVRGGTYRKERGPDAYKTHAEKVDVRLAGEEGKVIHVRPAPAERVIIDGGFKVENPSAWLWMWDFEVLVSEPTPTEPVGPGSHPEGFTRPWGGLHIYGGEHVKFINFLIHDNRQGVSWWSAAGTGELYGAIIYDNGWPATDRGHGHCIYTQNQTGVKTITDCILTCKYPGTYTMHAYGSRRAYVDNYTIEGNIAYALGRFLVGGGRPSHNIVVKNNALYGISMQIGYNAPENEDCVVTDNIIVNGGLSINRYKQVTKEGNLVLGANDERPDEVRVVLRPNRYDSTRAHLVIYNFPKQPEVTVDVGAVLKDGDPFALQNPKDFYGPAVHAGTVKGGTITVPMAGEEFGVYVLLNMAAERWQMLRVYGGANALYVEGRLAEALAALGDAGMGDGELAARMRRVASNAEAAEKAAQAGDIAVARKAVDQILAAEPNPDNVYRRRALVLAGRFDNEAAELIARGQADMKSGDLPAAAAAFGAAQNYAPGNPGAQEAMASLTSRAVRDLNLAINVRSRDPARARELLAGVLAILPEDHPGHARAEDLVKTLK